MTKQSIYKNAYHKANPHKKNQEMQRHLTQIQ